MAFLVYELFAMTDQDPRAQELNNLKLALATFALQLDAFETRISVCPLMTDACVQAERPVPDTPVRLSNRQSTIFPARR
jgi:hypothetical protein